jgi:hypothetical protein
MYVQGDVIRYHGDFWVVLNARNGYLRIMRPHVGNEKREIKAGKAQPVHTAPAKCVRFKDKEVLVTAKGFLISLVSERLLLNTTKDGQEYVRLSRCREYQSRVEQSRTERHGGGLTPPGQEHTLAQ